MNSFYNHLIYPAPNAPGTSASMRSELDRISAGFDKLPTLAGNGGKLVTVKADASGLEAASTVALESLTVTSLTATNITGNVTGNLTGNVTAATGTSSFNNMAIAGTVTLSGGAKITGLSAPINGGDAANKDYVDSVAQGLDIKTSVRVATTGNISLSGAQTIDGIALTVGDRVLVKSQTAPAENGIYVVAAGAWARSTDMDIWTEFPGAFFFVEQGSINDNTGWVCTANAGGTVGSTAVTFEQFSGAGQITAGNGMTKSGNTLNIETASASRIVVNADNIDLATTGITAGAYQSVTVDIYGRVTAGSNPTTLAGYGITDAYTKSYIDTTFGDVANAEVSAANAAASASAAAASATAAAASYDSFDDRYLGAKSTPPIVDNDGNALTAGSMYFDLGDNLMKVRTTSNLWVNAGSSVNGTSARQKYTATAGQTSFAITYDVGFVDVWLNGLKLESGVEFTATNGTTVLLAAGATAGDLIDMIAYGTFVVSNSYTKAEADNKFLQLSGGTLTGALTLSGAPTANLHAATKQYVDGFLPLSGGNLTGGVKEARVALGAGSAINIASGNYFTKTISGVTTFSVSNVPAAGTVASFIIDLTNGGSSTITWWSGMKWAGGTAPSLTAAGRDVLGFFTHDAGTTWTGLMLGKDVK